MHHGRLSADRTRRRVDEVASALSVTSRAQSTNASPKTPSSACTGHRRGFHFRSLGLEVASVTGSCSHPTGTGLGAILFGPAAMAPIGSASSCFFRRCCSLTAGTRSAPTRLLDGHRRAVRCRRCSVWRASQVLVYALGVLHRRQRRRPVNLRHHDHNWPGLSPTRPAVSPDRSSSSPGSSPSPRSRWRSRRAPDRGHLQCVPALPARASCRT